MSEGSYTVNSKLVHLDCEDKDKDKNEDGGKRCDADGMVLLLRWRGWVAKVRIWEGGKKE